MTRPIFLTSTFLDILENGKLAHASVLEGKFFYSTLASEQLNEAFTDQVDIHFTIKFNADQYHITLSCVKASPSDYVSLSVKVDMIDNYYKFIKFYSASEIEKVREFLHNQFEVHTEQILPDLVHMALDSYIEDLKFQWS